MRFAILKSLRAALITATTLLPVSHAGSQSRNAPTADFDMDTGRTMDIFKKASARHDINIGPMININDIDYYLARGARGRQSLDFQMRWLALFLHKNGYNLVTMTCPADADSAYLPAGISVTKIRNEEELDYHFNLDAKTNPILINGKPVKREFTYISLSPDGTLIPLTADTFAQLKLAFTPHTTEVKTSPVTLTNLDNMAKQYKETCAPKF